MIDIPEARLKQQLEFLYEIDKLKTIFRRTNLIADPKRLENSAEHSWHLAFYVLILSEYANVEVNLLHVLKMVLLHDMVEIDAGDTFGYDEQANLKKQEREQNAANRIFGMLPVDQCAEFMTLWQEFEAGETVEAKFANGIDRLHPVLQNYMSGGGSWIRHDICRKQVEKRIKPIEYISTILSELVSSILDDSVKSNLLKS